MQCTQQQYLLGGTKLQLYEVHDYVTHITFPSLLNYTSSKCLNFGKPFQILSDNNCTIHHKTDL